MIPALIRKCEEAKQSRAPEIAAWGTGNATREFLYVEDAAEAIVDAAEKYAKPESCKPRIGRRDQHSRSCGHDSFVDGIMKGTVRWDSTKPDGQPRRCLDTSRALAEFGWRARTPLREGLQKTMAWFREEAGRKSRTRAV